MNSMLCRVRDGNLETCSKESVSKFEDNEKTQTTPKITIMKQTIVNAFTLYARTIISLKSILPVFIFKILASTIAISHERKGILSKMVLGQHSALQSASWSMQIAGLVILKPTFFVLVSSF